QVGPGFCPICGMALEPESVAAEAAPNPELADMTRRFWIGLVLTLPVLALEMGGHLTNLHMLLGQNLANWLQFVFATPVVLWGGWAALGARLAPPSPRHSQHVHADRQGHRRGLALQRGCDPAARPVPAGVSQSRRRGRRLFRSRGRHHGACAARPSARAACAGT